MSVELVPAIFVLVVFVTLARGARNGPGPRSVESCFGGPGGRRRPGTVERTFLFADLVGFTALAEADGDAAAASAAEHLRWAARRALRGDAALVKGLGDGVMIAASTPAAALATAVALRDLVDAEPGVPPVAVGLHRGKAVEVAGDYFGSAVNLAARLVEEAGPGQILCTESVAGTRAGAAPFGSTTIRGVRDPVVLYELTERVRTGGER